MLVKKNQKYIIDKLNGFRIRALKDFGDVKKGDLGGYVESYHNLSQEGNCWAYDYALVADNAVISGDATAKGYARIYDNAKVYGEAKIWGSAIVRDNAEVYDHAKVFDTTVVCENAKVSGNAVVFGNREIKK